MFRIDGNTYYDQKNKIPMKIPEFKRSRIRLIVEFCRIPNGFPNQVPPAEQTEGREGIQCWQHSKIRKAEAHQAAGRADYERTQKRATILPNQERRAEETSKRTAEGSPEGLSVGRANEEANQMHESNQAKTPSRRKQANVVPNKTDGKRSSQPQRSQSPENN